MKKCPYCSEEIQDEALKCKHCKSDLPGVFSPEPSAMMQAQVSPSKSNAFMPLMIIGGVLCLIGGCFYMNVQQGAQQSKAASDDQHLYQNDLDVIQRKFVALEAADKFKYDNFQPRLSESVLAIYLKSSDSSDEEEAYKKHQITASTSFLFNGKGNGTLVFDNRTVACLIYEFESGDKTVKVFVEKD